MLSIVRRHIRDVNIKGGWAVLERVLTIKEEKISSLALFLFSLFYYLLIILLLIIILFFFLLIIIYMCGMVMSTHECTCTCVCLSVETRHLWNSSSTAPLVNGE